MSCNFIHIQLRKKNSINFNNNKNTIIELFKSSIGNGVINSFSSNFIFKLKALPSKGYSNQAFELSYNKKLIKKNNAKMIYKPNKSTKDIKIFNQKFILNNMKRSKIIINNKQYDLKENKESIINKDSKIRINFFDNIIKLNSMFEGCESLSSALINFNTKYLKTINNLFYGCSSLLNIDDISNNWNINDNTNYNNPYIILIFFKLKNN